MERLISWGLPPITQIFPRHARPLPPSSLPRLTDKEQLVLRQLRRARLSVRRRIQKPDYKLKGRAKVKVKAKSKSVA
jgi:hypothetical protein